MARFILSLLVGLLLTTSHCGCSSSRKGTSELRGLMLVETSQLGRNRSYYSKHEAKKLVNKHEKFHRKIKKKSLGGRH